MVKLTCLRCSVVMKNLNGGIKLSQYTYSKKRIEMLGGNFITRNHLSTKCVGYYCPKCWKIAKNVKVEYLNGRRVVDVQPGIESITSSGLPDNYKVSAWTDKYIHKPTTVTFKTKDNKIVTVPATKIVPRKK